MTDHPSPDVLADLDAGITIEAAVAAHVADCAQCTADLAQIRQVSALLAELPSEPIPADVASRIDAALAGERAKISAPATVVPLQPRAPRSLPAWAAAAAAAVVLFGGGALLVNNLGGGRHSDNSGGALSAANAPERTSHVLTTGSDYRAATLADQLPTLLGQEPAKDLVGSSTTGGNAFTPAPAPVGAPAGAGQSTGGAKSSGDTVFSERQAARDQQLAALRSPANLAACLVRALGADVGDPLAVDLARFNGEPAVVVALTALGRTDKVDIYVLDPGCPEGAFVYFARLPLPQPR